jgi:hypothetical protein
MPLSMLGNGLTVKLEPFDTAAAATGVGGGVGVGFEGVAFKGNRVRMPPHGGGGGGSVAYSPGGGCYSPGTLSLHVFALIVSKQIF